MSAWTPKVTFHFCGVTYWRTGWFGCQLASMEWRRLPAGTTRKIKIDFDKIYDLRLFSTHRRGLKIEHAWTIPLHGDINEQNAQIRKLNADLASLV